MFRLVAYWRGLGMAEIYCKWLKVRHHDVFCECSVTLALATEV